MSVSLGSHIRSMRNSGGISLCDLAQRTGIPVTELHRIEDGTITASREQVFRLAHGFNAEEREIFRINQATKISVETADMSRSGLIRHSRLGVERISNMKADLSFLEQRNAFVSIHVPVPALLPFVESIVYCKGHNLGRAYETTIPDGTSQLQINLGRGARHLRHPLTGDTRQLQKAWVIGTCSVPVTFMLAAVEATVYVRFKPGGLFAFTKINQSELHNTIVDASDLFGPALDHLWSVLAHDPAPEHVFDRVEAFLLDRLPAAAIPPLVEFVLRHHDVPLKEVTRRSGYSAKYVTKVFQKWIGIGPKNFQRIVRFSTAISYLNQLTDTVDWPHIVLTCGYHDQAHFIKDFRQFTGFSPMQYLALGNSCAHYFHTSADPRTVCNKLEHGLRNQ